jgi:hypothetical protein
MVTNISEGPATHTIFYPEDGDTSSSKMLQAIYQSNMITSQKMAVLREIRRQEL